MNPCFSKTLIVFGNPSAAILPISSGAKLCAYLCACLVGVVLRCEWIEKDQLRNEEKESEGFEGETALFC